MAKDDSTKKEKERKHKSREKKLSPDSEGISKKSNKQDKKDRKEKKLALRAKKAEELLLQNADNAATVEQNGAGGPTGSVDVEMRDGTEEPVKKEIDVKMLDGEEDSKKETKDSIVRITPVGALVPFANPLADEKAARKVFKIVKKATKAKALKRGVKEVVKALRKSPAATNKSATDTPFGIVVIAADISPMDVISHLPVLCEDHGIPYIYVTSRAELGAASSTKRPTSVVLVGREKGKVKEKKKEGEAAEGGEEKEEKKEEDWGDVYADLVKVVRKAGRDVRI